MLSIEYCARAIVQYLAGDIKLFNEYQNKATEAYEKETSICTVGEMIPVQVKRKLYEMVS